MRKVRYELTDKAKQYLQSKGVTMFYKQTFKNISDGIKEISDGIKAIPVLNSRYLELLTPMEALYKLLLEPEGDDSLVMHHIRCMGLAGGWKAKEQYEKGKKHGRSNNAE